MSAFKRPEQEPREAVIEALERAGVALDAAAVPTEERAVAFEHAGKFYVARRSRDGNLLVGPCGHCATSAEIRAALFAFRRRLNKLS